LFVWKPLLGDGHFLINDSPFISAHTLAVSALADIYLEHRALVNFSKRCPRAHQSKGGRRRTSSQCQSEHDSGGRKSTPLFGPFLACFKTKTKERRKKKNGFHRKILRLTRHSTGGTFDGRLEPPSRWRITTVAKNFFQFAGNSIRARAFWGETLRRLILKMTNKKMDTAALRWEMVAKFDNCSRFARGRYQTHMFACNGFLIGRLTATYSTQHSDLMC